MNKKILLTIILGMFLILPLASAGLLQSNKVFIKKSLDIDKRNWLRNQGFDRFRNYGTYEIHDNGFLGLVRGAKAQEYTLLESGNSIINAWAYLEVTNYKPSRLLSDLWFKGGTPRDVQVYYLVRESYTEDNPVYKTECSKEYNVKNKTTQNVCSQVLVRTDKITKYRETWKPYNGQTLPAGTYKIKITGKLPKVNHAVDWVLKSGTGNYDLDRWTWWNESWSYKREISGLDGNISALFDISRDDDMNYDFGDVRFVDTAGTTELNYTIESFLEGNGKSYENFPSYLTTNLVSYYKLDETSGTTATDAHGTNDGTNNGATVGQTGKINYAYDFDGSNDYVDIGQFWTSLPSALTQSAWVKTSYSGEQVILTKRHADDGSDWATLMIDDSGYAVLSVDDSGYKADATSITPVNDGSWHLIVGVKDGTSYKIYVDGTLGDTLTDSHSMDGSSANYHIGHHGAWSEYFNGKIDEVGIWSRALNSSEIAELYNATKAKFRVNNLGETSIDMYYGNSGATTTESASDTYFNPVSYYYLDGDATDAVGANDGTVSGATTTTGYIGDAYDFDGVDDHVDNSMGSMPNTATVCSWIKTDSTSDQVISENTNVGSWGGTYVRIKSGKFSVQIGDGSGSFNTATSSTSVSSGVWYFVCGLWNVGSATKVYVNGNLDGTAGSSLSGLGSANNLRIGDYHDLSFPFDGKIDEFGFWNRALTSTEIQALYNQTAPSFTIGAKQSQAGVSTTLNSPANNTQTNNPQITFNWTSEPTGVNLTNSTLYIWYSNGTLYDTDYYSLSGNESVTTTLTKTLQDGSYIWNAETCGENVNCSFATDNWTLSIDATSPTISIDSPTGTYNYLYENYSLELNFTAVDANLDTCWYEYNNTNTTVSCTNNTLVNKNFNYTKDKNTLTVWANDTYGNLNSSSISWDYKVFEDHNVYNNETMEGNIEEFYYYTLINSGLSVSNIYFIYNNTSYTADSFNYNGYKVFRKTNFLIPNVNTDTNITFYWRVVFSDDTAVNLTNYNQTVYNLEIGDCSTYTNTILNLTLLEEEPQTKLSNPTIETVVNIYSSDGNNLILNYSTLSHNNPTLICLNRNLSSQVEYSLDSLIRYESPTTANEYYNIVNYTLNSNSGSNNINLYDLNLTDSTEFQLTFTGSDFLPVENALIYVNRQYISENTFKTVELPKTDYNGQTILHLVRNDVIYNIIVMKDGKVLGEYDNLVAFCDDYTIGDCNIELNAFDSVESIYDYYSDLGLTFSSPTYNLTTHQVSFDFLVTDGSSKEVIMNITRNDIFGNESICETSLTSSGGTLTCNIDPNIEDSTLKVEVYSDGNLVITSFISLDEEGFGEPGYLILFIMAISFALLFSGSKSGVLISMLLTFVGGITLGLMKGDLIGLGASGIWLLVITIIGLWKLNSERKQ